jgi:putative ABC transport system permease protein
LPARPRSKPLARPARCSIWVGRNDDDPGQAGGRRLVSDVPKELPVLVYTLDAVLVVIAVTTLVAIALLSVRERIRDFGVLKAIGLTPAQITSSLVSAQAALAAVASLLSIPVGIGLYLGVYRIASGSTDGAVLAPWWWLALVPIAIPGIVTIATSLPARLAIRIPTADAIRYE